MGAPLVEISGLRVSHSNGRGSHLLEIPELVIHPGEKISLTGASGCGKSTLIRVLAGLITRTSQPLRVQGEHLSLPRKTSIVMQDSLGALNPLLTSKRTVSLFCGPEKAAGYLEACKLDAPLHDRYPQQLSGGQRQRVAIAAALAAGPQLLLADEPTSALDPLAIGEVSRALLRSPASTALVLSTHELGLATRLCERHLRVANGTVFEIRASELSHAMSPSSGAAP